MNRYDVMLVVGVGALAAGMWMVHPAAGVITLGLALILAGVAGAWSQAMHPGGKGSGK